MNEIFEQQRLKKEKNKATYKLIFRWLAFFVFAFMAFYTISEGKWLSTVLFIIGGVICLPNAFVGLKSKMPKALKYVMVILCLIVGTSLFKPSEAGEITNNSKEENVKTPDTLTFNQRLKIELKSASAFKGAENRDELRNLQIEIAVFSVWAKMIDQALKDKSPENKELGQELKAKVIKVQVAEFPKLRKAYVKILADKLWKDDIYVTATSNNVNFTGGYFASNSNIQSTQEAINEQLSMFRFRQARYRWYKGQAEYTSYDVSKVKDSELVSY